MAKLCVFYTVKYGAQLNRASEVKPHLMALNSYRISAFFWTEIECFLLLTETLQMLKYYVSAFEVLFW